MKNSSSSIRRLLPRSRRCMLIASMQIAFLIAFFVVHVLFLRTPKPPVSLLTPSAQERLQRLCPGIAIADTEEEPSMHDLLWIRHRNVSLPENDLSRLLHRRNSYAPRNQDLFPALPPDHLVIVLYVHNRPAYLRVAVDGLSKVDGISEALLIVSHDGFFEEMNAIIEGIRFCQVKQIFAPFSPHIFKDQFPGISPGDCQKNEDPANCCGNPDQYGNHRAPHIVSLKHHWWWMMNTVWDGLHETRSYADHILFIEEDHYLFPNAIHNIQTLSSLKACKCPSCFMANLAPADIGFRGERVEILIADKIGNMGYAFNRTVWKMIHAYAEQFCSFDDYNWDITMWSAVYPNWGSTTYSLRGPRPSALHFGKCGLHQGNKKGQPACLDEGGQPPAVEKEDRVLNIAPDWSVKYNAIKGYDKGFKGWGGWGDDRDRSLCLDFASMYHLGSAV